MSVIRSESRLSFETMNNPDILLLICSRLDNYTIEKLATTPIWNTIKLFADKQYFWYLRTQYLLLASTRGAEALKRSLNQRPGEDWKSAYHYLSVSGQTVHIGILRSSTAMSVLLELGSLDRRDIHKCQTLFSRACEDGFTSMVKLLLDEPRIDISNMDSDLAWAIINGHIDIVKLLLADKRITEIDDDAFISATENGDTEMVKLLIPRMDPRTLKSALNVARENEYDDIIELLESMQIGYPEPKDILSMTDITREITTYLDNETLEKLYVLGMIPSLKNACQDVAWWRRRIEYLSGVIWSGAAADIFSGHSYSQAYQILEDTLEEKNLNRIDFSNADDNIIPTRVMFSMGLDPSPTGSMCSAAETGSVRILRVLLDDGRMDPNCAPENRDKIPIMTAVIEGHYECVELLLSDHRVSSDIHLYLDCLMTIAQKRGYMDIFNLLCNQVD